MYPQFKSNNVSYRVLNDQMTRLTSELREQNKIITWSGLEIWWRLVTRVLILEQTHSKCPYCSAPVTYHDNCEYCKEKVWSGIYE